MAIVFSGGGSDYLSRTADVNPNSAYTILFYYKLVATTGNYQIPLMLYKNGSNFDDFATNTSNVNRIESNSGGTTLEDFGSTFSYNTWYHIAVRRNSATSLEILVNGVSDASITDSVGSRGSGFIEYLGAFSGSYGAHILVSGYKVYQEALSGTRIAEEADYFNAYDETNLVSQSPFTGADLAAVLVESTGTSWTQHGTPTISSDAPSGVTTYTPASPNAQIVVGGSIDLTPSITANTPSVTDNIATLTGKIYSTETATVSCVLKQGGSTIDTADATVSGSNWTVVFSGIADGTYTIVATGTDQWGNDSVTSSSFDVTYVADTATITSFTLSPSTLTISTSISTYNTSLSVTGTGDYDASATYESSNESVATVNSSGVITILDAGDFVITATSVQDSNFTSTLTGTAYDPPSTTVAKVIITLS